MDWLVFYSRIVFEYEFNQERVNLKTLYFTKLLPFAHEFTGVPFIFNLITFFIGTA